MTELKPCPFCGGEATLFKDNYNKLGVMCENCNLYLGIELECDEELFDGWRARIETFDEVVELWNRRTNEELIPKLQVLDDMYADKGVVSMAARDYYYEHYADEAEKKRMDIEDIVVTIIGVIVIGVLLLGVIALVMKLIGGK